MGKEYFFLASRVLEMECVSVELDPSKSDKGMLGCDRLLTAEEIVKEFRELRQEGKVRPGALAALLQGSRLSFPQKSSSASTMEQQKRRAFLHKRAEARSYSNLSSSVSEKVEHERVGKLIPNLSIGMNMILAGFTCFVAGYVGAAGITERQHERLAVGLIAMIVILFVEMALFVIKESKFN
jgi:hypothetical protein